MSETYTSSNGLILPGTGTDAGIWGNELNTNFGLIDTAVDGVESIALTTGSYNLNIADGATSNGRYKVVEFTGSPSGPVAVSVTPVNIQKVYWIVNTTTQSVVLSNGTGSTLTIPTSTTAPAFCDGNGNVIGLLSGNTSVFNGITNNGNLVVNGTTTLNGATSINAATTMASATVTGVTVLGTDTNTPGTLEVGGVTHLYGNTYLPAGNDTFIGGVALNTYIGSQAAPSMSIVSVSGGSYILVVWGTTVGSRTALAIGTGTGVTGTSIPVPTGFNPSNGVFSAALAIVSTTSGNNLDNISVTTAGNTITATASDNSSHSYTVTATWTASVYATNY